MTSERYVFSVAGGMWTTIQQASHRPVSTPAGRSHTCSNNRKVLRYLLARDGCPRVSPILTLRQPRESVTGRRTAAAAAAACVWHKASLSARQCTVLTRWSTVASCSMHDSLELHGYDHSLSPRIAALRVLQWVTLYFRNTKVLHRRFTPNNRFNT